MTMPTPFDSGHYGSPDLIYTWSIASGPSATFSNNGTHSGHNTNVTWSGAGLYLVKCVITDPLGGSTTIYDPYSVIQVPQGAISISPSSLTVGTGGQQTFTSSLGTGLDQFGHALTGTWTWSLAGPKQGLSYQLY